MAARIRKSRPPEPYKGKGVRYAGEHVTPQGREEGIAMTVLTKPQQRLRRRRRVRAKIRGSAERPRLSVYRSNRGVFAQLIDDDAGSTPGLGQLDRGRSAGHRRAMEQAKKAGEMLAKRATEAKVETCVFDRGGYRYHGRVKALAEGAREGGLKF